MSQNLTSIVVTRNKACHVKTLHSLLRLNLLCFHHGYLHNIHFVNDDPFERNEVIQKHLKTADRILFIDYSVFVDNATLDKVFAKFENYHGLVFPCVKEGINWEMFKKKVRANDSEPVDQCGMEFDTVLGQKIGDSLYWVKQTEPKCWVIEVKPVARILKGRKGGEAVKLPSRNSEMFEKLITSGVKICAWTASRLVVTYPHECLSNILESAGVKTN